MSDERNEAGQFTSAEVLTGRDAELRDGGFKPMKDPEKTTEKAEEIDVTEAARLLNKPAAPIIERAYKDGEGESVDKSEAISLDRAARDLAATREKEAKDAEAEQLKAVADEADKLRGKDEAKAESVAEPEAEPENDVDRVAKALKDPPVAAAIEEHFTAAETQRKAYLDALSATTDIARATFFDQYPEFASITAEQMPAALNQLAQQDPSRYQGVMGLLNRVGQLAAQQQQEQHKQAYMERQAFEAYAKAEDQKAEDYLKSEPAESRAKIEAEIFAAVKEYAGLEANEFMRIYQSDKTLRSASVQRMMVEAAKYRMIMKAKASVAAKPIPPVQRPGVSRSDSERTVERVRQLSEKFSRTPSLKNAAEALTAMRRERARG